MKSGYEQLIKDAYKNFNERNIDGALSLMDSKVEWPNGWEGGYVHGHDEVKHYWTRQWQEINPHVDTVKIQDRADSSVEVTVHQLVKNLQGEIIFNGLLLHVYTIGDGLIRKMSIEEKKVK